MKYLLMITLLMLVGCQRSNLNERVACYKGVMFAAKEVRDAGWTIPENLDRHAFAEKIVNNCDVEYP